MEMNGRVLSVSEMAHLLILRPKKFSRGILEGIEIHKKMGFDQARIFDRFYQLKSGERVLIVGKPDKIIPEEGLIQELKSFVGKKQRETQKRVGYIQGQFYCWLTDLPYFQLHLYDVEERKMTTGKRHTASLEAIEEIVEVAAVVMRHIDKLDGLIVNRLKDVKEKEDE